LNPDLVLCCKFVSAIDISDTIELFVHLQKHLDVILNKDAVGLIICFAYKEIDMLVYSSHCITVAAIATEIRFRKKLESFDGVLGLISPEALKIEVSNCAEMLYRKMRGINLFSGAEDCSEVKA
jgi:hypothetical protein